MKRVKRPLQKNPGGSSGAGKADGASRRVMLPRCKDGSPFRGWDFVPQVNFSVVDESW